MSEKNKFKKVLHKSKPYIIGVLRGLVVFAAFYLLTAFIMNKTNFEADFIYYLVYLFIILGGFVCGVGPERGSGGAGAGARLSCAGNAVYRTLSAVSRSGTGKLCRNQRLCIRRTPGAGGQPHYLYIGGYTAGRCKGKREGLLLRLFRRYGKAGTLRRRKGQLPGTGLYSR